MPNYAEDDLYYKVFHHGDPPVEGWISSSNLVDFQHLTTVHGIPDAIPTSVVFDKYVVTVRQESAARVADTQALRRHVVHRSHPIQRWHRAHVHGRELTGGPRSLRCLFRRRSVARARWRSSAPRRSMRLIAKQVALRPQALPRRRADPLLPALPRAWQERAARMWTVYFGQFLDYIEKYPRSAPFDDWRLTTLSTPRACT